MNPGFLGDEEMLSTSSRRATDNHLVDEDAEGPPIHWLSMALVPGHSRHMTGISLEFCTNSTADDWRTADDDHLQVIQHDVVLSDSSGFPDTYCNYSNWLKVN